MLDHYHLVGILAFFSFINALASTAAISVLVGNSSSYLGNMSTSTKRYLKLPGTLSMTVKLICQLSLGMSLDILNGLMWGLLGVGGLVLGCLCADGAGLNSPD